MQHPFWKDCPQMPPEECSSWWMQVRHDFLIEEKRRRQEQQNSINNFKSSLSNLINTNFPSEQKESGITKKILDLLQTQISLMTNDTKITPQDCTLIIQNAIEEATRKNKPIFIFGLRTLAPDYQVLSTSITNHFF